MRAQNPSTQVFAFGEYTLALRPVSMLPDLLAGYVNRFSLRFRAENPAQSVSGTSKEYKNAFRISEKLPHFLPLTFYLLLPKNPAISGKSEDVRGKK